MDRPATSGHQQRPLIERMTTRNPRGGVVALTTKLLGRRNQGPTDGGVRVRPVVPRRKPESWPFFFFCEAFCMAFWRAVVCAGRAKFTGKGSQAAFQGLPFTARSMIVGQFSCRVFLVLTGACQFGNSATVWAGHGAGLRLISFVHPGGLSRRPGHVGDEPRGTCRGNPRDARRNFGVIIMRVVVVAAARRASSSPLSSPRPGPSLRRQPASPAAALREKRGKGPQRASRLARDATRGLYPGTERGPRG